MSVLSRQPLHFCMFTFTRENGKRGFTLIELLVVIAIIGILSSVVLASLNSARKKGRDARRLADIKQIQLALELYYDASSAYPATLGSTSSSPLVTGGYIAALPADPGGTLYSYTPYGVTGSSYHLGADLEVSSNSAFSGDADAYCTPATACTAPVGYAVCTAAGVSPTTDFNGADTAGVKCSASDVGTTCYDVKA